MFLFWYVLYSIVAWFLLFDEYDQNVMGYQQTNFAFHERLRLAVLFPALPAKLLLVMTINVFLKKGKVPSGLLLNNFVDETKNHWAIIWTGSKADWKDDE